MFLGKTGTSAGYLKAACADMGVVAAVVDPAAVGSAGSVEVDHTAAAQVEDSVVTAGDCLAVAVLAVEGLVVEGLVAGGA